MRHRWEFNPLPFIGAWIVLGLPGFILAFTLSEPCDHGCGLNSLAPLTTASYIALGVWFGPFVLVIAAVVTYLGSLALWDARPKRVREPVLDDLREAVPMVTDEDQIEASQPVGEAHKPTEEQA